MMMVLSISPSGRLMRACTVVSPPAEGALRENDFFPMPESRLLPFTIHVIRTVSRLAEKLDKVMVVFSKGAGFAGAMFALMLAGLTALETEGAKRIRNINPSM